MSEQEAIAYSVYVGIDWADSSMMFAFAREIQIHGSSMLFDIALKRLMPG